MSATETQESVAPQKRRWLRKFSLRFLFVSLTLFCIVLGVLSQRARDQAKAVAILREAGGEVSYDFQCTERLSSISPSLIGRPLPTKTIKQPQSKVPKFLLKLLGVDFFHSVVRVRFSRMKSNPSPTDQLTKLPRLRCLEFSGTRLEEDDLWFIGRIRTLESLTIFGSRSAISGKKFSHLSELNNLNELRLEYVDMSEESMVTVGQFYKLRNLKLAFDDLSDDGIEQLSGLTNLESLDIIGGKNGLMIKMFNSFTSGTDTKITNESLKTLAALKKLTDLKLYTTSIDQSAIDEFKLQRPDCQVKFY